ncbi:MAG: hypothetical protein HFJ55_01145 [Clostridia bacterium]|nr:hypothetical protein [Clostridia bacterium]
MLDIVYFVPGKKGRYINRNWKAKITVGKNIHQEGYYMGTAVERENCWIFSGKPYIPSKIDIPAVVDFNPNHYRAGIIQDSVRYFLVEHKKSGGHFVICQYLLNTIHLKYRKLYFSDLLSFVHGKWKVMKEWPSNAEWGHANRKMEEYWRRYHNYYGEDFEIIRELNCS